MCIERWEEQPNSEILRLKIESARADRVGWRSCWRSLERLSSCNDDKMGSRWWVRLRNKDVQLN